MSCPDRASLEAFRRGSLPVADRDRVSEHVRGCPTCSPSDDTAPLDGPPPAPAAAPPRKIGRFVVTRLLGKGGMGVVYEATDPELGRRVAIKLLRDERRGEGARARLVREAQAMARLQHPNVVVVHEVGTHDGQVFVAMELVAGVNLAEWLAAEARNTSEILDIFAQAGRGLAAAHAAGIVHRDFKPANVMVDAARRARVADFGLARGAGETASGDGASPALAADLTADGTILGTPAYMAPEQRAGSAVGPLGDQYSFCVSLHEALFGDRSPAAARPPARGVQSKLRPILVRGLAERPEARHPSMDALLAALARAAAGPRRGRIAVAAAAAAMIAAAGLVVATRLDRRGVDACAGDGLAGVWDLGRKAELRAAFAATGAPYAAATWSSVERLLDGFAARWRERHGRACRGRPAARSEAALLCLDQRAKNLAAVAHALGGATARGLAGASDAAAAVDDLSVCDEAAAATEPVPQEGALRDRVQRARARLAASRTLDRLAMPKDGEKELRAIVAEARAAGYRALEAEALTDLCRNCYQRDEYDEAVADCTAATQAAEAAGHDLVKARAWRQLQFAYSNHYQYADARRAADYARAVLFRLGPEGDPDRISLDATEAQILTDEKKTDEALEVARRALSRADVSKMPNDPGFVGLYSTMGGAFEAAGRFDEAEIFGVRALDVAARLGGERHPMVAKMMGNLGNIAFHRGQYGRALPLYERGLELSSAVNPPGNLTVAFAHHNLGLTLQKLGRRDEALRHLRESQKVVAEKLGADNAVAIEARQAIAELERAGASR